MCCSEDDVRRWTLGVKGVDERKKGRRVKGRREAKGRGKKGRVFSRRRRRESVRWSS